MNGARQRTHRTATEQLEARIGTVETLFDELAGHYARFNPAVVAELDARKAQGLVLQTDVQQLQTAERLRHADDRLVALEVFRTGNTLGGRLRWLLTGR